MYSYKTVKEKSKRENNELNDLLHPFASKFSIYFTWIFINLGLSANAVTGLFFVVGLAGSFLLFSSDPNITIFAFILWRLHIIFDMCDGEVARFTQKFSSNGAYWDYMIHSILYPLYFINISISQYFKFQEINFLFIGIFGGLILSLQLAVKNNYFRSMLFNNQSLEEYKEKSNPKSRSKLKHRIFLYATELVSFEGFFLFFIILNFIGNEVLITNLLLLYMSLFFIVAFLKFILFSVKGYYPKKN